MPIERRERLADAVGGAAVAAELRVGADGADERHADERARQHAASPTTRATPRSSRHSLSQQPANGGLREGKDDLLERRPPAGAPARGRQTLASSCHRAFAAHAAAAEQHEAVADARGVADLMDREEQRAARGRVLAQRRAPSRGSAADRGRRTARRTSSSGCGVSMPSASSTRLRWPFDSVPIGRPSSGASPSARRPRRAPPGLRRRTRRRSRAPTPTRCAGQGAMASGR